MKIAVYISGHGFGHLAQLTPVLNHIHSQYPHAHFLLCTSLPGSELHARLNFDFDHQPEAVDVGVIQKSAIEEDREASLIAMHAWVAAMPARIELEADRLRAFAADLVISNISPLAFPAARRAGVPSVALASLDWHSIYSHWLEPDDPTLIALKDAYQACEWLLTPTMSMPMPLFSQRTDIPLIAAHADSQHDFVFREGYEKKVLVIFGGEGQPTFEMSALAKMPEYLFLIPGDFADAPENVQTVRFSQQLKPIDLMTEVDLVVCKPGYGILSECWRTGTPIAWVERPDFPEFPMLQSWLNEVMPAAGMSRESFARGDWRQSLEQAMASTRVYPALDEDGGMAAATAILKRYFA